MEPLLLDVRSADSFGEYVSCQLPALLSLKHRIVTKGIDSSTITDGGRHLILVVNGQSNLHLCAAVETEAYQANVSCIFLQFSSRYVCVGPTVTPGNGPCWSCYSSRLKQHMTLEEVAVREHLDQQPLTSATYAVPEPVLAIATSVLAQRITALASANLSGGTIWELNYFTGASRQHYVVPIHNCPRCSSHEKLSPQLHQELRELAINKAVVR